MSDTVEAKIRSFILTNFMVAPEDSEFSDSDSLLTLGVIDSMGVIEVAGFLRSEFGVDASPDEIRPDNFDSIAAIAKFVERKRGA